MRSTRVSAVLCAALFAALALGIGRSDAWRTMASAAVILEC